MQNTPITFKHSGTSGDIIYWMAGLRECYNKYGRKVVLRQFLNQPGFFYQGAEHPWKGVMMNEYAWGMLKRLVEEQEYIERWDTYGGEKIDLDMDKIRVQKPIMPYGNIIKWFGYCFGDIMPDISQKWLKVKDTNEEVEGKIIINRTSRYQNQWITYFFLSEYQDRLIFSGLPDEHAQFCKDWKLDIPLLKINDFYDIAVALNSCKFFIGNQSMTFAMAEGLKIPRILEVCPFAPNVDPVGEHAYDFVYQEYFEYYVKYLDQKLN